MIDTHLSEKVVFITGANHGIGAATAKAFATQGSKVFVTYYRVPCRYSDEELKKARDSGEGGDVLYRAMQQQSPDLLVRHIEDSGGMATAHEADLEDSTNIPMLFDLCEKELGPVDVLVNNHTFCVHETFDPALTTDEGWGTFLPKEETIDEHFALNTRSYVLLMAEYVKRYLDRHSEWGRIINISTDAAHAHVGNISYAASKHAIESYTRTAAQEIGKYGITVNVVAPGPVQTGYISPEAEGKISKGTPLRRVGEPEDVADVIVMLASEQARWLTGQLIYAGGGWRMHQ
jgi:3-oxoacyl-[acyl-carrier protein] reductase